MKRKELSVGQEVEIQTGTTYKRFNRAIVVFTEPWVDTRIGQWSKHNYQPARHKDHARSGVAVATKRWGGNDWRPEVVQLSKLQPKGTEAAYEAQERADRDRRAQLQLTRDELLAQLRERTGITDEYGLRFRYFPGRGSQPGHVDTSTIEIDRIELERLLDELESYRSDRVYEDRTVVDSAEIATFDTITDDGTDG